MAARSSRHQQLKTLAVTIGVAFTVVIILISRFQPLTLQARTSSWQVASDTSPNVSVTVDNTVTDNSIFHVTATALRTRVEGPVPVLTQGVTLCRHFDPVQQQCISGRVVSGQALSPFRLERSSTRGHRRDPHAALRFIRTLRECRDNRRCRRDLSLLVVQPYGISDDDVAVLAGVGEVLLDVPKFLERRHVGGVQSAIDQKGARGHEGRIVAGEEQDRTGHFLGLREATHWHVH